MAFIRGGNGGHQLCLNELTDALKIDQVPLQGRILHLKDIQQTLKSKLEIFGQVKLSHTIVQIDTGHLEKREEPVVLQDLYCSNFVIDDANLV